MAVPIKDRQHLPDYAHTIAKQIEDLGFRWTFDYEGPVLNPDQAQRLQIRDVDKVPGAEVAKYAACMKRGDKFPPGVMTADGRFVDYNTRNAAAFKLGWPHFPVFRLNVRFEGATPQELERLYLLGAAFNTHGPKPLNRSEITAAIRKVVKNPDWTAERVAALLGIQATLAVAVFAQFKAEDRAARLGVALNGSVSDSNKTLLGRRSAKLNDAPFRAVAQLAQDAGLNSSELRDLCNRVQAEGTDEAKVAVVAAERESRGSQIAQFRATNRKKPLPSSDLLRRTRYIEDLESKVPELLDYNPHSRQSYLTSLERAVQVLSSLADAQRAVMAQEAAG